MEALRVCWIVRRVKQAVNEVTDALVVALQQKEVLGGNSRGGMAAQLGQWEELEVQLSIECS